MLVKELESKRSHFQKGCFRKNWLRALNDVEVG